MIFLIMSLREFESSVFAKEDIGNTVYFFDSKRLKI